MKTCRVCGKEIPRPKHESASRYNQRTVCIPSQDPKPVQCWRQVILDSNTQRKGQKVGSQRKKKGLAPTLLKPLPLTIKTMPQDEADRLDAEQARINIACHIRDMERCGYVGTPGRSLSKEEIAAVAHLYTPPDMEVSKDYNPHFRGNLSRRGVEL